MKFETFFKFLYIPLAIITAVVLVTVPLSFIIVGFVWAPLFISFVCAHYLLHQKNDLAKFSAPKFIKVLMWLAIVLLGLVWVFIGLIFWDLHTTGPASDGGSAAWGLLGAPFIAIPGVLATIAFFFFKTAVLADLRKEQQMQTAGPNVIVTNVSAFSYVQTTRHAFLLLILVGSLVYALEHFEYTNIFGPEKLYTIQSPEFNQNGSIFYIQAQSHPPESSRPYSVNMRASSGRLDKVVGSVHNWIPSVMLYHEGNLYSLFDKEKIDGVLVKDLNQPKNVGGKWVYDGKNNETFSGDIVVVDGEVYVFEFISPTCRIGVYDNCFGDLYPANYTIKNDWYNSRVINNVSYAEFESDSRQSHQFLLIQNGKLVPGNSSLFDQVSRDYEILPIVTDSGIRLEDLISVQTSPLVSSNESPVTESQKSSTPSEMSRWNMSRVNELGINFSHPADWSLSIVTSREFENGARIRQMRVYPEGIDQTAVLFFVTDKPIEKVRDIELMKSNTDESTFIETTVNGLPALQRIDNFSANECTKTVTFIEKDQQVYGSEIVECPTHSPGYDQIRIDIANSLSVI